MSLYTTESVILPLLVKELEEVILDSHLVRLTNEIVEEGLEVWFARI